eukprot:803499-Lingulodinium_polyedra.AAC.1
MPPAESQPARLEWGALRSSPGIEVLLQPALQLHFIDAVRREDPRPMRGQGTSHRGSIRGHLTAWQLNSTERVRPARREAIDEAHVLVPHLACRKVVAALVDLLSAPELLNSMLVRKLNHEVTKPPQ